VRAAQPAATPTLQTDTQEASRVTHGPQQGANVDMKPP
jgi:hypothetical protein